MKIGRYDVCGMLGRGGMGVVYKVRQPVTGRIAALKILQPADTLVELMGWDRIRRQFEAEAVTMASLDHPNIAAVWDYDEAGGIPFFVMEYYCLNLGMLMGESYRVEAPTRRLPLDKAVDYTLQTLAALARMHHAGIVHRDVKPFNLMLTHYGRIKVIDFGLSRLRGETGPGAPSGIKVGSPYYAPPEQEADPERVDGRADCYPVGVMLYRMLTGVLPDDAANPEGGAWVPASRFSPDLDAAWDAFFERAMARAAQDRFAGATAMRQALEHLYQRWCERLDAVCSGFEDLKTGPGIVDPGGLRAVPIKTGTRNARALFALDRLWRPVGLTDRGVKAYSIKDDGTVVDAATGLQWQRAGSEFPITWTEAHAFVAALNTSGFAGATDWRLPTVEELVSLLERPPVMGDFCLLPVFDPPRPSLWTCDRKSHTAAWFVSAAMAFVGWQDFSCRFHVRAVRSSG
jgi:serine/threonine-protein kinase